MRSITLRVSASVLSALLGMGAMDAYAQKALPTDRLEKLTGLPVRVRTGEGVILGRG